MDILKELSETDCVSKNWFIERAAAEAAAEALIDECLKKGYIEHIACDAYAVTVQGAAVCSKYRVGTALFTDACITHHGAFEYYGFANQVYYEITVASSHPFDKFEYDGVTYRHVPFKTEKDMINENGIQVTSLEQTVADSISDLDSVAGYEEVLRCIALIPALDSDRLMAAIERYNSGFLYQKCGYCMEYFKNELSIPESFFERCRERSSGIARHLEGKAFSELNKKWLLYVPASLTEVLYKGFDPRDITE